MGKLVKISDITRFGNALASSLRSRYKWSRQLRKAVKLHKATDRGEVVSIQITVGEGMVDKSGNPLAGMAKAYEYGGEGTYPIAPRLATFLSFRGTNDFAGRWIRTPNSIDHPRMRKRGDIQAAIAATRARATAELKLAIRKNLINEIKVSIKKLQA